MGRTLLLTASILVAALGTALIRLYARGAHTRAAVVAGPPLLRDPFPAEALAPPPALQGLPPDTVAMQVTPPDPQRLVGLLQAGSQIRVHTWLQNKDNDKAEDLVFAQSGTGGSAALWFRLLGSNVQQDDGRTVDRVNPGAL
jgi:hypothetical protein